MTPRAMALAVFAAGVVALVAALPARAAGQTTDFGPLIVAALEQHIQPRHEAFAAAAADLETAAQGFCSGDRPLNAVQDAYQGAMDGWMGVQHIAFGPIQSFNRRYRVQFWPDKRHTAPEQFAALMAEQPRDIFKPNGFTFASVAIQGLPVVERLAFSETPPEGYACELLVAVSGNIRHIARDLAAGWADGGDTWGQEIRDAAGGGSDLLGTPTDVAGMLLGSVSGELKLIREYKVQAPLENGTPESPIAERSARNIRVNLDSLAELYAAAFLPALRVMDPDYAALMERAFAQTRGTAEALDGPLGTDVPDQRRTLETLAKESGALRQLAAEKAADHLNLVLGFNALDGD